MVNKKMKKSKLPPRQIYPLPGFSHPKGIPRSFLLPTPQSVINTQQIPTTSTDMPVWETNPIASNPDPPTLATPQPIINPLDWTTNDPMSLQPDTKSDVQQPYSPSDVYTDSLHGTNDNLDEFEGSETSETGQLAQKRLSAFERLGPVSQPKKPKLTINLMFNKEQAVREVVDVKDNDTEKYTPVNERKSMKTSTDEIVMKYLALWPWSKRVVLRKSVTARHSKTVMMLEQEQMEEVYDRESVFIQVTVKGYPKHWNKENVLDTLLEVVKGKSFIPCFTEFTETECKFLVLRSRPALLIFHKCGFALRKDEVELSITISHTDLSLNKIDFIPRLVLRKRIAMGFDGDKKLNLSEFTLKEDISHFLYYPLDRMSNQIELVQLQNTVVWEYLTDLDLSHNRLTSITGLSLSSTTPKLKHLNLSHNYIEKVTSLLPCKELPLQSLWLEGNPLCHDYIDSYHYIKVIKLMFEAVKEIDGVAITLKGDIPTMKRNYCPENAVELIEKFLEIYFPLLDTSPEDRGHIQGLYTDDAVMTITYKNKLHHSPVYRGFRNLFMRTRCLADGEMDSIESSSSIIKLINRWPEFEHDPMTFTVDVLHHDDFTTICRVGGIMKIKAESLAEDEHLLAFTRTFVLRTRDGSQYKIQNEMVFWEQPTEEYATTAFKMTTVKTNQLSLKFDSTPSDSVKKSLIDLFMKLTTLNEKSSERCLELKNWNFRDALDHFSKLLKLDSLDSLTNDNA